MYRSLYKIIAPKIEARESGVIKLLHADGEYGIIQLDKGEIVGLVQNDHTDKAAANIMFRWVNVAVVYDIDESQDLPIQKRISTDAALKQLKKIDPWISQFKKHIGGCEAVFKFIGQKISGEQNFTPQELNISFLLDGENSIKEVQGKYDMNELDLLLTICKLIKKGLIVQVRPHQPMDVDSRSDFLEKLNDKLSDITGPVASVIINDAFEAIGAPPEQLAQCDITHLYTTIAFHLEDDEKETFSTWADSVQQ